MNTLLNAMKNASNYTYTENGAVTHKTTNSALLDMFGMGGSMRNRSDEDIIFMFKKAYDENPEYALKCLFYLRDVRGGQGERRFFRTVINWLAREDKDAVIRNLEAIPEMGRWDDLYSLMDTPCENEALDFMLRQITLDVTSKTPSLLAKWLKSENTSSAESRRLGTKTRLYFGLDPRTYRKMLSALRTKINVLEKLMSQNRWDEIEFDKIPSKAGLIYKNVFATKDVTKARYAAFMANKETKVNAGVLNPVDIAEQIFSTSYRMPSKTERLAWDKYWANLKDYYNGREERGIAVVDVSGSMYGTPLYAAVSMGAYIAERGKGPFQNHFITFSSNPELVKFEGVDLYDKFKRAQGANWNNSTDIAAVFDLLLNTAKKNHVPQEEMPETLYIFSDMEFDGCMYYPAYDKYGRRGYARLKSANEVNTLIEYKAKEWAAAGYKVPNVIFWNLDARQDNVPAIGDGFFYVSGNSMNVIESILSRTPPKSAVELMMNVLNRERYKNIH